MDAHPHYFGNLDPHQIKNLDPDRHKIYDPDPHQFADVKPKCMEYEPILALFQGFKPFFKARIWIRIRIIVKSRIRIGIRIRIRVISRIRIRINVMRILNTAYSANI